MICANPDSQVSAAMQTIMELPILMAFAVFLYLLRRGTKNIRFVPYDEAGNVATWKSDLPSTETSSTGGNQPMPIVNKYTACYMWKRTG